MRFDVSPERVQNREIEGINRRASCDVVMMDSGPPLSVAQLEQQQVNNTPEGKRLMLKPGSGRALRTYMNENTTPLLVAVDLVDTLISRLSHRLRVAIHQACKSKDMSLTLLASTLDLVNVQDLSSVQYADFARRIPNAEMEQADEDEEEEYKDEENLEEEEVEEEDEEQDVDDMVRPTKTDLSNEYEACKLVVYGPDKNISHDWLENLLKMVECSLLLSYTPKDGGKYLAPVTLRSNLLKFCKSDGMKWRVAGAHPFGSLLWRGEVEHIGGEMQMEDNASPTFLYPGQSLQRMPFEQPLHGPKAGGIKKHELENRKIILADVLEDKPTVGVLQDDVPEADVLVDMSVSFWKTQLQRMGQRKKKKTNKNKRQRVA